MKTGILFLVLLSPVSASPAAAGGSEAKLERTLAKGQELLAEGKALKAAEAFERADRQARGTSLEALLGLATAQGDARRYEEAVRTSKRAVKVADAPDDLVRVHNAHGMALYTQNLFSPEDWDREIQQAEEAFRRALEASGGRDPLARFHLAKTLIRSVQPGEGDLEEARRLLSEYAENGAVAGTEQELAEVQEWLDCMANHKSPIHEFIRDGDLEPPKKVLAYQPTYTPEALKAKIKGTAIVQAVLDQDGNISCARLRRSLPMGLGESTLETVKGWKYEPARFEGQAVSVYLNVTMNFRRTKG